MYFQYIDNLLPAGPAPTIAERFHFRAHYRISGHPACFPGMLSAPNVLRIRQNSPSLLPLLLTCQSYAARAIVMPSATVDSDLSHVRVEGTPSSSFIVTVTNRAVAETV